jgi:hypothetical protein
VNLTVYKSDLSEICSADKIAFVDTVNGADLCALATARAERVIDGGKIVFNLDSTILTGLFALHTADTAVCTALSGDRALVVIGALDNDLGGVVNDLDNVLGAGANADAATDTFLRVNVSDVVDHRDSILRAGAHTISVSEASPGAGLVTVVGKTCRNACLGADVIVLSFNRVANSVTRNESHLFNNFTCFNTEY